MKPIHKHLHKNSEFPFHIVYKDRKSPQHELPDHFHVWHEIIYIHSGTGTIFIDQTFYDLYEGDIIILSLSLRTRFIVSFPRSIILFYQLQSFLVQQLFNRLELEIHLPT